MSSVKLPEDFSSWLEISNAAERFGEALEIATQTTGVGVDLLENFDHAAIFTDPPQRVAGPLKKLGYQVGWDSRCYPSPVDGCDYINVSAKLSAETQAHKRGWFDHVAIVHPVDPEAYDLMLSHGYGNPFIHHLTWGIVPPDRRGEDDLSYASCVIPFMIEVRQKICQVIGDKPGTLICALPPGVVAHSDFAVLSRKWFAGISDDEVQVESMQGGGFLLQFFVLTGGRIEVALREGTSQTFNPKSVDKISRDEISTNQGTL
ncbi:MAG: hypothetical protein CMJ75_02755 [Planctomycetaceae bacterium]|nr:hypothetical protein [Planctomycetaceae bacterium]